MEITINGFLEKLKERGLPFDLQSKSIEDKDFISMTLELELNHELEFGFKEMKVNNDYEYIFSCSLDKKIKANCNYSGILFLNYSSYNMNIGKIYSAIEKDIKETIAEIEKGGLFNDETRYESKINTIIVEYNDGLNEIKLIKEEYKKDVEKEPNYRFGCGVLKIENSMFGVKRVDFSLGIQAFLKIANYGKDIEKYMLGLIENFGS